MWTRFKNNVKKYVQKIFFYNIESPNWVKFKCRLSYRDSLNTGLVLPTKVSFVINFEINLKYKFSELSSLLTRERDLSIIKSSTSKKHKVANRAVSFVCSSSSFLFQIKLWAFWKLSKQEQKIKTSAFPLFYSYLQCFYTCYRASRRERHCIFCTY